MAQALRRCRRPTESASPISVTKDAVVDVLIHFHGFYGGPQKNTDVYSERIEAQLAASLSHQTIAILLQGAGDNANDFGVKERPLDTRVLVPVVLQRLVDEGALPNVPDQTRVVMTAHSGGGNPLGQTLDAGLAPENLGEVILFDAINGIEDELPRIKRWLGRVLAAELAHLVQVERDPGPQKAYLAKSFRFRGYHSTSSNYAKTYAGVPKGVFIPLASYLSSWFASPEVMALDPDVQKAFAENFKVMNTVMSGHGGLVGKGQLAEELKAFANVSAAGAPTGPTAAGQVEASEESKPPPPPVYRIAEPEIIAKGEAAIWAGEIGYHWYESRPRAFVFEDPALWELFNRMLDKWCSEPEAGLETTPGSGRAGWMDAFRSKALNVRAKDSDEDQRLAAVARALVTAIDPTADEVAGAEYRENLLASAQASVGKVVTSKKKVAEIRTGQRADGTPILRNGKPVAPMPNYTSCIDTAADTTRNTEVPAGGNHPGVIWPHSYKQTNPTGGKKNLPRGTWHEAGVPVVGQPRPGDYVIFTKKGAFQHINILKAIKVDATNPATAPVAPGTDAAPVLETWITIDGGNESGLPEAPTQERTSKLDRASGTFYPRGNMNLAVKLQGWIDVAQLYVAAQPTALAREAMEETREAMQAVVGALPVSNPWDP
jgi:hypothetical protein